MGLVGGHTYSVIKVAEVVDSNGFKSQIVNIRNPWGSFEWNGPWGDKSYLWTEEAQKKVNFVDDDNDGLFWMQLRDFKQYFSNLYICKYDDNKQFFSQRLDIKQKGEHLFKMQIKKTGHYTFAIS